MQWPSVVIRIIPWSSVFSQAVQELPAEDKHRRNMHTQTQIHIHTDAGIPTHRHTYTYVQHTYTYLPKPSWLKPFRAQGAGQTAPDEARLTVIRMSKAGKPWDSEDEADAMLRQVKEDCALFTIMVMTEEKLDKALQEFPFDPEDVRRALDVFPTYFDRKVTDPQAIEDLGEVYADVHCGTTVNGEPEKPERPRALMILCREYICLRVIYSLGFDAEQGPYQYEQQFDSQIFMGIGKIVRDWDRYRELLALFKQAYYKIHETIEVVQKKMLSRTTNNRKRAPRGRDRCDGPERNPFAASCALRPQTIMLSRSRSCPSS